MSRGKILSTKQLDDSVTRDIEDAGFQLVNESFIHTELLEPEKILAQLGEIRSADAFVFTSVNALKAIETSVEHTGRKPVFCISGKTLDAAQRVFGREEILATADDGSALAENIAATPGKTLAYFCGNIRREILPAALREQGFNVKEIVVYQTTLAPLKVQETFDAILFFSPSAVTSFFSANQLAASTCCFAIGNTTAESVKQYTGNTVLIAERPTQEHMAAAIKTYFK